MTSLQKSIAIVDDDKDIVSVITKTLERSGIEVHGFDNPVAALEHIKGGCYDCWLILSDVRMPHMTGFELVKHVRQLRPDIVVLLMTAFEIDKEAFSKELPSTRVGGFIQKPFRMFKLLESIKEYESMRQKA